jgi:hypothetical protein
MLHRARWPVAVVHALAWPSGCERADRLTELTQNHRDDTPYGLVGVASARTTGPEVSR